MDDAADDVRVAACQMRVDDLDVDANLATVSERVAGLPDDVDLAVFPEYALTGFVADQRVADVAVDPEGAVVDRLRAVAAAADVALLVGFVEEGPEQGPAQAVDALYNTAAYVRPDGEVSRYRKRHLWGGEREVLTAGADPLVVETPAGEAGVLTCYDLNFVGESAAMTDRRVDLLVVPGAWPAAHGENWRLLCRARALDGVRWVVAAGRTGRREVPDARVTEYAGRSMVVRPDGSVMAACNLSETDVVAALDPAELAAQRDLVGVFDDGHESGTSGP
jgi:(R)-amidase